MKVNELEAERLDLFTDFKKSGGVKKFVELFPESHWFVKGFSSDQDVSTTISIRSYQFERYIVTLTQEIEVHRAFRRIEKLGDFSVRIEEITRVQALEGDRFNLRHGKSYSIKESEWQKIGTLDDIVKSLELTVGRPVVGFLDYKQHSLRIYSEFKPTSDHGQKPIDRDK